MTDTELTSPEAVFKALNGCQVSTWAIEIDEGQPRRLRGGSEMLELFGIADVQVSADNVYDLWYDNINPTYRKLVNDAMVHMAEGIRSEVTYSWLHPVRGEVWIRCSGLRDMSYAKGVRIFGLYRDISDLIQFQKDAVLRGGSKVVPRLLHPPAHETPAWREQTTINPAFWAELIEAFPGLMFVKDVDDGLKYCYSNWRYQSLLGVQPVGKDDFENYGEVRGRQWRREDEHILATGQTVSDLRPYYNFKEGDRVYTIRKYPYVSKEGRRYIVGVGMDITELYMSQVRSKCLFDVQAAMFSSTDELESIRYALRAVIGSVDWIPCLFYRDVKDPTRAIYIRRGEDGKIIDIPAERAMLAYLPQWQRYLESLRPGETRLCSDVARIAPECSPLGLGACVSFRIQAFDDHVLGYASIFTKRRGPTSDYADALVKLVTEVSVFAHRRWEAQEVILELEKQKDELQASRLAKAEANAQAKSLFLASMSHEIRTPLNAIIGLSQELQNDDISDSDRHTHLRSISLASQALLDLINDVLDISKLESGHIVLTKTEVGLSDLTRTCGAIFSDAAARRGLTFFVGSSSDELAVQVDHHRVRQILLNLLGNAIKFTRTGGVTLTSDFVSTDASVGRLRFTVTDTGCGIAPEDRERIFGMFEQASGLRGTRVANSGTGLGLALCKRLALAMSGDIVVESELGKGSSFTLILTNVPYRVRTEAEIAERAAAEKIVDTSIPKFDGKILIVDDVQLNLKVVGLMLKRAGIPYVTADGAVNALKVLEKDNVAVMLTDLWMPDMSGEALAKHVRADPRFRHIPIAALTADVDSSNTFDLTSFDAILPKPVTQDVILGLLRKIVAK